VRVSLIPPNCLPYPGPCQAQSVSASNKRGGTLLPKPLFDPRAERAFFAAARSPWWGAR
jgi:hypothetical protein